jgi:Pectate lyase superfamily protein
MTTAFTAFTYRARDGLSPPGWAPTSRLTKYRLIDRHINVKDWGAVGDGIHDDTQNIRDAIAYAFSPYRPSPWNHGIIVYFPRGTYLVTNAIDCHQPSGRISLIGAGRDATIIKGNFQDYIFKEWSSGQSGGLDHLADMTIWNEDYSYQWSGCFGNDGQNIWFVKNCRFIGMTCCNFSGCFNGAVANCIFEGSAPIGAADSAAPGPIAGSFGAIMSTGAIYGCRFFGFDVGLANGASSATTAFNNYFYRCNVGIYEGFAHSTWDTLANVSYDSMQCSNVMERCKLGIYSNSMISNAIVANVVKGKDGVPDPAVITNITRAGNTATVVTQNPHRLSPGTYTLQLVTNPLSWTPDGSGDQYVSVTVASNPSQFTYTLNSAPSGSFSGGSWNYPLQAGIFIGAGSTSLYAANALPARVTYASFAPWGYGNTAEWQYGNVCMAMDAPYGWNMAGARGGGPAASSFEFFSCTGTNPPVAFNAL